MPTPAEKRATFRQLHQRGCFALPNPWDIGSTRYLQHLGFKALATTSAGFAFSRGLPDYGVPRDVMLAHIRELVEATDLPVNADFEDGYGDNADDVSASVRLCLATGVAGLSIEDSTRNDAQPLRDVADAVERIKAARAAIDQSSEDVVLVGRCESFLAGQSDIDEVVRRLTAYAEAGADCLYAPGVANREHISAIVRAVAPKAVNVLVSAPGGLAIADAEALGVRRVSVGGALARTAWGGFLRAATELAQHGRFDGFADAAPHGQLDEFFRQDSGLR